MKEQILKLVTGLRFAETQQHENLVILPVFNDDLTKHNFISLPRTLTGKLATVREVSEGGHVPELSVTITRDSDVFILEGEELVGAKQNRVVNLSMLLAKGKTTIIPVSCTERGRWSYKSPDFSAGDSFITPKMRAEHTAEVTASIRESHSFQAEQGKVWNRVAMCSASLGTVSNSDALDGVFKHRANDISNYTKMFQCLSNQVGIIAFLNGKWLGLDILPKVEVFSDYYGSLIKSYCVEAISVEKNVQHKDYWGEALKIKPLLENAECENYSTVGLGDSVRISSKQVVGQSLIVKEEVLHVSLFPNNASMNQHEGDRYFTRIHRRK
jgi:hypothetical protein